MKLNKEILLNLNNIGILRTDRIGDMILTLPMVKVLKKINPTFKIFVIASKYVELLLKEQELIEKFFFIENKNIRDIINEYRIEAIFHPRPIFKEAKELYFSSSKYRIGSGYRIYSFLYNYKIYEHRKVSDFNEVEYNVRMISHITKEKYEIELLRPKISKDIQEKVLNNFGSNYIIIHIGSLGSAPNLPIDYWNIIIKTFVEKLEYKIYITGTEKDNEKVKQLNLNNEKIVNLCGKLNLAEMIALINNCKVILANSTGVIHIAAAFDKSIIGFYPNSKHFGAERWGPYSNRAVIIKPELGDDLRNIDINKLKNLYKLI